MTTAAYAALGTDAASVATRKALAAQFNTLRDQIDKMAADISKAENSHGFTGLKLSGTLSTSLGSFSDVQLEVRGANGRSRDFIVSDGKESRTVSYFDNSQSIKANLSSAAKTGSAQVSTMNIGGTVEDGDIFTITVAGQTFNYTATSSDVAVGQNAAKNVAAKLQSPISTAIAGGRLQGKDVATAALGANGTITLTGIMPNMVRTLIEKPAASITAKVPSSATGATMAGMSV